MPILKVYDGTTFVEVPGGGDVVGPGSAADNAIARYNGTTGKTIQGSTPTIGDDGVLSIPGLGTGGVTIYDLKVGNTANYGMVLVGRFRFGRTSFNAGSIDLAGAVIFSNLEGPDTGEIEFIFTESTGDSCRFALPKSGVGNATYNPRSMLLAGPAPANTDFVKVSYWQGQGIFHNLLCDTSGVGADLGVQNDLEVERYIYNDEIKESTTDAGVTVDGLLIKDGAIAGHLLADGTVPLSADWIAAVAAVNRLLTIPRLLVDRTLGGNEVVHEVKMDGTSIVRVYRLDGLDLVAFVADGMTFSALATWLCTLFGGAGALFNESGGAATFTVSVTGAITLGSGTGIASLASGVLSASTAPAFTDFTNAQHDHGDADDGGTFAHDNLTGGTIANHDTGATGAELDTLTDGSDADALHAHDTLATRAYARRVALTLGRL